MKIGGFYKLNNYVLTLNCIDDIEEIQICHRIAQSENGQRFKDNNILQRGFFYMSYRTISADTNISESKCRRIIKKLINNKVIRLYKKGTLNPRTPSIWEYVSVTYKKTTQRDNTINTHNETHSKDIKKIIEIPIKDCEININSELTKYRNSSKQHEYKHE
jgi:hypothetical protein